MTASRTTTLRHIQGAELGPTEWHRIGQDDVNAFGRIVSDMQWIHVDPVRARKEGPYGAAIAHGALVLSIATTFAGTLLPTDGSSLVVNGGFLNARLRRPVLIGTSLRGRASVIDVSDLGEATVASVRVTVDADGGGTPVATALLQMVIHG